MIPERLKSNINLDASPTDPKHIVNKEYVDGKQVEILWEEYQNLSEEEKNNGTTYFVPDMPVSPSGEVIGEVERLNGALGSNVTGLDVGSIIPFVTSSNSNMTITDGLVTLKKGKTYRIFCDLRFGYSPGSDGFVFYGIKDSNGKKYGVNGYDESDTRTTGGFGSHTSVDYVLTPDENITLCVFIDNGENVTTLYASSAKLTILEIPSIQACIDVSDEHIQEVANTDRNLKTYTTLSQIGLTTGCTISDILNALTDYSQIVVNSSYINNTDRPLNSPADELITITRLWHSRITIISTDRNGKICTGLTSYSGTTVTFDGWKRICDTKVTDIPITQLTFNNTTNYTENKGGMHSHYRVKNGICYVGLDVICTTPKTGNWSYVFSDGSLPLPELDKARYFTMGGEDGSSNINGIVDNLGRIGLMFGNSGVRYVTSLSYPVSES